MLSEDQVIELADNVVGLVYEDRLLSKVASELFHESFRESDLFTAVTPFCEPCCCCQTILRQSNLDDDFMCADCCDYYDGLGFEGDLFDDDYIYDDILEDFFDDDDDFYAGVV